MLAGSLVKQIEQAGSSCEVEIDKAIRDADDYDLEVQDVTISGDTAPVRVPIIAVTASATSRDRDRCLAAGMDDYISKPIDVVALDLVLGRWLSVGRPASGA